MPMSPARPCAEPGCPVLVRGQSRCDVHGQQIDRRRGTSRERGYDARWDKLSEWFRSIYPLCGMRVDGVVHEEHRRPQCKGRFVKAGCVDHIIPVSRGGDRYDPANLQSLCIPCNTAKGNR